MPTMFKNAGSLVTNGPLGSGKLGVVEDGAFVCGETGALDWIGPASECPEPQEGDTMVDLEGALVLPGFVEAHTHLVFAGDRCRDYADRCAGVPYEEVARRGGGIRLTVTETRIASHDQLLETGRARLNEFLEYGVTTVEIKSGYGLSVADEIKCLEVIQALGVEGPTRIEATVLGAHIVPDEFKGRRDAYVTMLLTELLPEVAARGLARFVDVFCERGAFTLAETRQIFEKAVELGLGIKVHAEQLSHTGSARLAAEFGAVSADHLEFITREDARVLAESGTVAVLLPGAALFLGGNDRAPARMLIDEGVKVALSTDFNPGTCPSTHLPMMTTLGCSWLGLAPYEALQAITVNAAQALDLQDGRGTLVPGSPCDFSTFDLKDWRALPYRFGHNGIRDVWIGGKRVAGMS